MGSGYSFDSHCVVLMYELMTIIEFCRGSSVEHPLMYTLVLIIG